MEIGGYLGLESLTNSPYYPDLVALNLGRTALTYLLEALKVKTLFVPYFLCDSVTDKCVQAGIHLSYYHVSENLNPLLDELLVDGALPKDTYLLLVNHYGQLTDDKISNFKDKYNRIIVDNTHSFFQKPLENVPTFYSCRKFLGVSDGAYLYSDVALPAVDTRDISKDRMSHILGRFEGNASEYYNAMLQNAETFADEPVKTMSLLTSNILGAIDYDNVRTSRNANYRTLDASLGAYNTLSFIDPDGPLAYPFFHPEAMTIRKSLASIGIYVPTYWSNVIESMDEDSVEYQYAANILALPVDQRYGDDEMNAIADAVIALV